MKIVVAVKQVPEISEVQVDPETGSLKREGCLRSSTLFVNMHWIMRSN